jgi:hypothetical protein
LFVGIKANSFKLNDKSGRDLGYKNKK